jgi:hypothetical protein
METIWMKKGGKGGRRIEKSERSRLIQDFSHPGIK